MNTTSAIFEVDFVSRKLHIIQEVETYSALQWLLITVNGEYFLALASFFRNVVVYELQKTIQVFVEGLLNTSNASEIYVRGATSIDSFIYKNETFLIISCLNKPTDEGNKNLSMVLKLGTKLNQTHSLFGASVEVHDGFTSDGRITYQRIQIFNISFSVSVKHFIDQDTVYLILASASTESGTFLYKWNPCTFAVLPYFKLVQTLDTKVATSLSLEYTETWSLVISQHMANTMIVTWNGSLFTESPDETIVVENNNLLNSTVPASGAEQFTTNLSSDMRRYIIINTYCSAYVTSCGISLYKAQNETVQNFAGPKSICIDPSGRFVYVAAYLSNYIVAFSRSSILGKLTYDSLATFDYDSSLGFPRGISSLAICSQSSDSEIDNLYASIFSEDSILVFRRNKTSGSLHLIDSIQNGKRNNGVFISGLDGTVDLSMSPNCKTLYAIGFLQSTVVSFSRDLISGMLLFSDRITEGERRIGSINDYVDDTIIQNASTEYKSWATGSFPLRLGGNAFDTAWTFTARDVVHFSIEGETYVAVAASDSDFLSNGLIAIFVWNSSEQSFMQQQLLEKEIGASSVVHFVIEDVFNTKFHYLAVGNSWRYQLADKSAINIYQWDYNSKMFVHDHSIECFDCYCLRGSSTDQLYPQVYFDSTYCADFNIPLYPSAIRAFEVHGASFLAVAYMWDGTLTQVPSFIMRWNQNGSRVLSNGVERYGEGFFPFQRIDSVFAMDVEFAVLAFFPTLIFASNKAEVWPVAQQGWLDMFQYNAELSCFVRSSAHLPTCKGTIISVALFSIKEFGSVLAVSCFQGDSGLYLWNETNQIFSRFQTFNESLDIRDVHMISGFYFFESGNEVYLAVSMSVCELDKPRAEYLSTVQPCSAILQWSSKNLKFGEIQSITEENSWKYRGIAASNAEKEQKKFALRLDAGCASRWDYLEVQNTRILIVCSATRGAIAYKWDFDIVVGLSAPVSAVTFSLQDSEMLLVAGRDNPRIVVLTNNFIPPGVGEAICNATDQMRLNVANITWATGSDLNSAYIREVELQEASSPNFVDIVVRYESAEMMTSCTSVPMWNGNGFAYPHANSSACNFSTIFSSRCWFLNLSLLGNSTLFTSEGLPTLDSKFSLDFTLAKNDVGLAHAEIIPIVLDRSPSSSGELIWRQEPALTLLILRGSIVENVLNKSSLLLKSPENFASFQFKSSVLALNTSTSDYEEPDFVQNISFQGAIQRFWFQLAGVQSLSVENDHNFFEEFFLSNTGNLSFKINSPKAGQFNVTIGLFFISNQNGSNVTGVQFSNFFLLITATGKKVLPKNIVYQYLGQIDISTSQIQAGKMFSVSGVFSSSVFNLSSSLHNISLSVLYSPQNSEIFASSPIVHLNGTVSLNLRSTDSVDTNLTVVLICAYSQHICPSFAESTYFLIILHVKTTDSIPTFLSVLEVLSIENSGPQIFYGAVYNYNDSSQGNGNITFKVNFSSTVTDLFSQYPRLTSDGSLHYTASLDKFGYATLSVCACMNVCACTPNKSRQITIKIIPSPRVTAAIPNFGPLTGGNKITVIGKYFGSELSRGYYSSNYFNFSVLVCGSLCVDVSFLSDTELECVATRGIGTGSIYVNISDGMFARGGVLFNAYTYTASIFGGQKRKYGAFISFGPQDFISDPSREILPFLQQIQLSIIHSIRAMVYFKGSIVIGGDIAQAGNTSLNNIFIWNGNHVKSLQNGLDGPVNAMIVYESNIVVGGSFSYAFGIQQTLHVGGICGWTGEKWFLIGNDLLDGVVTALASYDSRIFVAGRFGWIGSSKFTNLAVFNGSVWADIGGGVDGGYVTCMAFSEGKLVLGGNFNYAGSIAVKGLAIWDGEWSTIGNFNGDVLSTAVDDTTIYIGGSFTEAGGNKANHLAFYRNGILEPLGSGVQNSVHVLKFVNGCLLIGSESSNHLQISALFQLCDSNTQALKQWNPEHIPAEISDSIHAITLVE